MRTTIRTGAIATMITGIVAGAIAIAPLAQADTSSPPPLDFTVADAVTPVVSAGSKASDHATALSRRIIKPVPVAGNTPSPFLFTYQFDHKLKVAGGNFTVDHAVVVVVRYDSGATKTSKRVIAHPHPITPGGAVYVATNIPWCTGNQNGYAQAYDESTKRWSPRVRVDICDGIDGTGDFNNQAASD